APDLLSAQRPYLLEGFTKLSQFARLQHQLVLELLHDQLELRLRVLAERMSLPAAVVFRFEQLYLGPELLDLRPLEVQVEGAQRDLQPFEALGLRCQPARGVGGAGGLAGADLP